MAKFKSGNGPYWVKVCLASKDKIILGFKTEQEMVHLRDKLLLSGLCCVDVPLKDKMIRIYINQIQMVEFFKD